MCLTTDKRATTRLRAMRSAMGLSVRELARRMNIDASLVSRAERGLIPTWPRFRRDAAIALGLPEPILFPDA
jgi:transcriptional regulator with XRE-family HTH domain